MRRNSDSSKYIRIGGITPATESKEVWGLTYKCGSTSLLKWLPEPRVYTDLRQGDRVNLLVRDPRDRLVSAFRWFTGPHNCYIKDILESSPVDHEYILDSRSVFNEWVETALRHWNPHWAPITEIHPRWREFHLIRLDEWGKAGAPHEKKTRDDNEMWKEVEDGIDTRTRRVL
jgi:hypothetical protein